MHLRYEGTITFQEVDILRIAYFQITPFWGGLALHHVIFRR